MAPYYLTFLLIKNLRKAARVGKSTSRIVIVSSSWHKGGTPDVTNLEATPWWKPAFMKYCDTKSLNVLHTVHLARLLSPEKFDDGTPKITANVVNPGGARSNLWNVNPLITPMKYAFPSAAKRGQNVNCLVTEETYGKETGKFVWECHQKKLSSFYDATQAETLWKTSKDYVSKKLNDNEKKVLELIPKPLKQPKSDGHKSDGDEPKPPKDGQDADGSGLEHDSNSDGGSITSKDESTTSKDEPKPPKVEPNGSKLERGTDGKIVIDFPSPEIGTSYDKSAPIDEGYEAGGEERKTRRRRRGRKENEHPANTRDKIDSLVKKENQKRTAELKQRRSATPAIPETVAALAIPTTQVEEID